MKIVRLMLVSVLVTTLGLAAIQSPSVNALSGSEFQASRIIDDYIFFNGAGMDPNQIQTFLNTKVPTCEVNHTRSSSPRDSGPPYTCLKDYRQSTWSIAPDSYCNGFSAGDKSAAQIIYEVGRSCGVSQKVILITLQKEQSLVTDPWPWTIQYTKATGFGCPDTALPADVDANQNGCYDDYEGFFKQVYYGARQFKRYAQDTNVFTNYRPYRTSFIKFNPNTNCGGTNVYIDNQATAGLYIYTPYQPNAAALDNLYETGDDCSAYGNRNFWRMFNDWFGSTKAFLHNGISYNDVFDPSYYLNNNSDVANAIGNNNNALFDHFIRHGMSEGRQANASFNVNNYKNKYADLRWSVGYGWNLPAYYAHYIQYGKSEGRVANVGGPVQYLTSFNGIDYSNVYDFTTYQTNYPDIKNAFGGNDYATLQHFVKLGMSEGRQANASFNVNNYKNKYADLRWSVGYGWNLPAYYLHYARYGKVEGRIANVAGPIQYLTSFNGIDYVSVYDFVTYQTNYPDIKNAFGGNDYATLQHFVKLGMSEGRQANASFNVNNYKNKYADLRAAFGNNLTSYYLHYIHYGRAEGRTSS